MKKILALGFLVPLLGLAAMRASNYDESKVAL